MNVVQYTVAPGAYGCDTCFTLPSGEHAHASYTVSTTDLVPLPSPASNFTTLPKPSSVRFRHRPLIVSVAVLPEYASVTVAPAVVV